MSLFFKLILTNSYLKTYYTNLKLIRCLNIKHHKTKNSMTIVGEKNCQSIFSKRKYDKSENLFLS